MPDHRPRPSTAPAFPEPTAGAPAAPATSRNYRALDALNFFLADVRDGIGPFLAIWLMATHQWDPASIGLAMGAMPLASVLMLGPAGALADAVRAKRALLAGACALVALGCIAMTWWPTLGFVVAMQALLGMATAVLAPGLLAMTLGLTGPRRFDARMGRNEVFNHAGNVVSAVLAGLIGHFLAREGIFYLVAVFALLSMASVLAIRAQDIDHAQARGAVLPPGPTEPPEPHTAPPVGRAAASGAPATGRSGPGAEARHASSRAEAHASNADVASIVAGAGIAAAASPGAGASSGARAGAEAGWRGLLTRPLLGFAVAVFLFHAANAAMMPLVGQQLAHGLARGASLYMSACIIVAQLVMIPVAALAGRKASVWGRRPLLLVGFAVLPLRGFLYTVSDHPAWLIAVQALDGIGAGLLGVLTALVVADLTRGTGRTNLAHGVLAAATGLGAFFSNALTGQLVAATGYAHGFMALAGAAAIAFVVCWRFVPETVARKQPGATLPAASAALPAR